VIRWIYRMLRWRNGRMTEGEVFWIARGVCPDCIYDMVPIRYGQVCPECGFRTTRLQTAVK